MLMYSSSSYRVGISAKCFTLASAVHETFDGNVLKRSLWTLWNVIYFPLQIYKGSETTYTLEDLEQKTEYRVRIGTVRVCSDGSGEIIGAFSPTATFTTRSQEPVKVASSKASSMSQAVVECKPLTDQQWAMIILLCFIVLGILIAITVQKYLSYSRQPASWGFLRHSPAMWFIQWLQFVQKSIGESQICVLSLSPVTYAILL